MENVDSQSSRTRGYKKKERTRKLLLDAGLNILAHKGEALTISDVVNEAGVSNGTFYNYFADRDALFDALAKQLAVNTSDRVDLEIHVQDPALRFSIVTANALSKAASDHTWAKVILRLESLQNDSKELATRHLPDDLNRGYDQGRFSVGAEEATIDLIVAAIRETIKRIVSNQASTDYIIDVITGLLCSLGLERKEAKEIAAQSVTEAKIQL